MIKINNLNKYFYHRKSNEIHVINDVTLQFPETGLVTIFGESGCGKTTLMNVLGGLDDFYNGSIEIDEFKVDKYSSKKIDRIRNEKIGYIFQNYLLLPQRTVYDNLILLLNMYDISLEEKNARIDYVLEAVGMLKYKKKNVNELSGGQQQRVAIARALIKSPSLILADEPTGNLDEKNTIQIMNIIKKISKDTLVILVSHEKSIATSYSDYLIEISDGKITNQGDSNEKTIYQYEDDNNLYLKEFEYKNIKQGNINIDFYSNEDVNINVQIVYKNGKFYLQTDNDSIFLDDKSEIKMVDDYKKVLDTNDEINDSDYNLDKLEFVKTPSLSFKEQCRLASSNLKKMRKRTIFLAFPLLIIIVLTLLIVQNLISATFIDRQNITILDSHVYNIDIEKGDARLDNVAWTFGYEKFMEGFLENNPNIEPVLNTDAQFTYELPDFTQLKNKRNTLDKCTIISLDQLDEDKLIYGRMPVLPTEVVIDKWVLENSLRDSTVSNFMDVRSFINIELSVKGRSYKLKIVGVCETEENSLYMDNWMIFDFNPSNIKKNGILICTIEQLESYLQKDLSYDLSKAQCLKSKSARYSDSGSTTLFKVNGDDNLVFDIIDEIDFENCPFDYALSEEAYNDILKSVLKYNQNTLNVYCKNKDEEKQTKNYVDSVKDYFMSGELKANDNFGFYEPVPFEDIILEITSKSDYDEYLQPYYDSSKKAFTSRLLITITIIIISVVIVYFSMKSYAIKNIYDIGVYRAIGINKKSITFVYALEILMISLKTTVVGGVLTYLVTNIIQGIPILDLNIGISFTLFGGVTLGLLLLNVLVGVLPIMGYLKLTPSQILTKYDI